MNVNRQHTTPVKYPKSKRNHAIAKITSMDAGVCAPITAIPLFRGDGIGGRKSSDGKWSTSRIGVHVEMAETKDMIVNKVRARVTHYCVPWLAFPRFNGSRDELDKSYAGEQGLAGSVIPFVNTHAWPAYGTSPFYDTLGLHGKTGDQVNDMYLQAYNLVWNYRARNRSAKIAERALTLQTLAPAFWPSGRFEHLVPDFDAAVMDGQVALNVVGGKMFVQGIGLVGVPQNSIVPYNSVRESDGQTVNYPQGWDVNGVNGNDAAGRAKMAVRRGNNLSGSFPDIFVEMAEDGITVSLSNLEMAKKVQAFAKLRAKYEGLEDDYIIDTYLMNGLRMPDEALKRPFLISDETFEFVQAGRYATDSGHLDEKAVSGVARGQVTLRVPNMDVGGIVIGIVEILPDQLFERQRDPFLHSQNVAEWPSAMRDYADPEKVDVIVNGDIDTDHATPTGLFGYAPKHWQFTSFGPGIGGKFKKPAAGGGTNVLRQRFWAHEEVNPALAENFYLCKGLTKSIFLDETQHAFELTAQGNVVIDGLTQFGGALIEATDNYDKVMAEMDTTRVKED